jgi:hypothetical protein
MTSAIHIGSLRVKTQMSTQAPDARIHTDSKRQSPRRFGRNRDSSGWGRSRRQEQQSLNPRAEDFEPLRNKRDEVTNPPGRGQDPVNGDSLNA